MSEPVVVTYYKILKTVVGIQNKFAGERIAFIRSAVDIRGFVSLLFFISAKIYDNAVSLSEYFLNCAFKNRHISRLEYTKREIIFYRKIDDARIIVYFINFDRREPGVITDVVYSLLNNRQYISPFQFKIIHYQTKNQSKLV